MAQHGRGARLRRLLPVRPLPEDGRRERPARPHRHVGHPRRHRPRDPHHPARHAGHLGHLPAARAARHLRRPGRRHERRPGRARPRRRAGTTTSTPPTASRSPAWASASTGSRSSSRSSPACGARPTTRSTRSRVSTTASSARRPCPSRCSRAARRSSSAATAPRRTPRLAARYANEFNLPFAPVEEFAAQRGPGASRPARTVGRDPADHGLLRRPGAVLRRERRRGRAPGRRHRPGRPTSCARTAPPASPSEVLDKIATFAEAGRRAHLPAGARPGRPRPPPPASPTRS